MPYHEKTHEIATVKGRPKLVGFHPKLTISHKHEALSIQHGHVYRLDGTKVTELPDWFNENLKKVSAEALDAVEWTGHRKPGPKPKSPPPPAKEDVDG